MIGMYASVDLVKSTPSSVPSYKPDYPGILHVLIYERWRICKQHELEALGKVHLHEHQNHAHEEGKLYDTQDHSGCCEHFLTTTIATITTVWIIGFVWHLVSNLTNKGSKECFLVLVSLVFVSFLEFGSGNLFSVFNRLKN